MRWTVLISVRDFEIIKISFKINFFIDTHISTNYFSVVVMDLRLDDFLKLRIRFIFNPVGSKLIGWFIFLA